MTQRHVPRGDLLFDVTCSAPDFRYRCQRHCLGEARAGPLPISTVAHCVVRDCGVFTAASVAMGGRSADCRRCYCRFTGAAHSCAIS